MTLVPRLHPEARTEIESAAAWYEDQRSGLGREFVTHVGLAIRSAADAPRSGSPIDGIDSMLEIRRVGTRQFPYLVVYVVGVDEIIVIAIAHERRRPEYWSGRIG